MSEEGRSRKEALPTACESTPAVRPASRRTLRCEGGPPQSSSCPLSSFSLVVRERRPRHTEAHHNGVATTYALASPTEAHWNTPSLDTGWTPGVNERAYANNQARLGRVG